MAFCFKCGTALPDGAVFCNACGVKQAVQAPQPTEQSQQPLQQSQQPPQQYQQPPQQYQQPPQQYQQPYQPQPSMGNVATTAVKKGMSAGAKRLVMLLVAALVIGSVVIVFCFTDLGNIFKSDEQLIRERIQDYEDACNNGDYEGMLDCMDGATRSLMESSMGVLDGIFSEGTGLGFGMTDLFGFAGMMGDYCNIEITNISIDGDHAIVDIVMSMNIYGMEEQSTEAQLPMVKEDGDWYIGGIDNMFGSSFPGT